VKIEYDPEDKLELKKFYDRLDVSKADIDILKYAQKQPAKLEIVRRINSGEIFNFYLWGGTRNGKTVSIHQMIYYLLRECVWKRYENFEKTEFIWVLGKSVLYFKDTIDLVRKLTDFKTKKEYHEKCLATRVLFLDNFMRYPKEENKCPELFTILNERLPNKELITGIGSNGFDESFMTESLFGRITDFCRYPDGKSAIYNLNKKVFNKDIKNSKEV
jgi:DNA replication protein DnaC